MWVSPALTPREHIRIFTLPAARGTCLPFSNTALTAQRVTLSPWRQGLVKLA